MSGSGLTLNGAAGSRRWGDALAIVAILVGSSLRIFHCWSIGPFWGDEAALAYNLISRSYLQLTRPLDLFQAAPVGFSPRV